MIDNEVDDDDVVDLLSSDEDESDVLSLLIDSRERGIESYYLQLRNRFRDDVSRIASAYEFSIDAPAGQHVIPISDFIFRRGGEKGEILNVLIERKAMKDIIGCSNENRHIPQLERMFNINSDGCNILMIEGPIARAADHRFYGDKNLLSVWNPNVRHQSGYSDARVEVGSVTTIRNHVEMVSQLACIVTNGSINLVLSVEGDQCRTMSALTAVLAKRLGRNELFKTMQEFRN